MRRLGELALKGRLQPTCSHRTATAPGLVLDPFLGSGTVAVVAARLQRDWLGIELNPAFAQLAQQRLHVQVPARRAA